MKCTTRFSLYFFISPIIFLSGSLQAMEIMDADKSITNIDWDYGRRDDRSICGFVDRDGDRYPYFTPENYQMQIPNQKIKTKYTDILGGNCNIDALDEEHRNTLWYVLETINKQGLMISQGLRIEGRDKSFAEKMSQRVLNLPIELKQEIAKKTNNTMMSNVDYEPLYRNIILDDEGNKQRCACIAQNVGIACGTCPLQYAFVKGFGQTSYAGPCSYIVGLVSWGLGYAFYKKIKHYLADISQDRDKRHGFKSERVLQEMKSTVVDSKKVD